MIFEKDRSEVVNSCFSLPFDSLQGRLHDQIIRVSVPLSSQPCNPSSPGDQYQRTRLHFKSMLSAALFLAGRWCRTCLTKNRYSTAQG